MIGPSGGHQESCLILNKEIGSKDKKPSQGPFKLHPCQSSVVWMILLMGLHMTMHAFKIQEHFLLAQQSQNQLPYTTFFLTSKHV